MPSRLPANLPPTHGVQRRSTGASDPKSTIPAAMQPIINKSKGKSNLPPFWLRRTALVVFFLVFVACIASLIALDRVIKSRNGLALTISSSSYSWTYGPTAIFIVILSLWRRVDYCYKLREPWRELLAGPSPAERSLLLDYITPFQITSFTRAFKRRHYSVAASVAGFFLLKVIILVSTTLFVMRETERSVASDVIFQDAFNASQVWPAYHSFWEQPGYSDYYNGNPAFPLFYGGSASSVWTYLARLNNVTNTETEWQLPSDMVTQRFTFSSSAFNVTRLEGPIDIFVPRITCEDAVLTAPKIEIPSDSDGLFGVETIYQFDSETCSNASVTVSPCLYEKFGDESFRDNMDLPCPPKPHMYSVHRFNCSTNQDTRYAIATADFEADLEYFEAPDQKPKLHSVTMTRSSAVMCKISYGIRTANATLHPASGLVTFAKHAMDEKLRPLHNVSSNDLAEMLWRNLQAPASSLIVDEKVPTINPINGDDSGPDSVLFQLMYAQLGRPDTLDAFHDTSRLKSASIAVLDGVALEFARQSFLVSDSSARIIEGWVTENRLYVRNLALWAMVASFSLLALICLVLIATFNSFPWIDAFSGSIAGIAAILSKNPDVHSIFVESGQMTHKELKRRLGGSCFFAGATNTGEIQIRVDRYSSNPSEPARDKGREKKTTWIPLTARLPVVILTFATPVLCIGLLELLYRVLRQEAHIVPIGSEDSVTLSYIIRIASTLVVFGVASLINNLDFTIVTFAPYSVLRSGSAPAKQSILFHLLSVNPFLVLFKSIRLRQFGAAASNAATLIAGFLTIVGSGLWVSMDSLVSDQISQATVNNWDRTWFNNASTDGGASIALNLIRYGDANTPSEMWGSYVLPKLKLSSTDIALAGSAYHDTIYTYNVQALQPYLNCSVVPQDAISKTNHEIMYGGGEKMVFGTTIVIRPRDIDAKCSNSTENNFADLTFETYVFTFDPASFGRYIDIPQSTAGQVSADCPSIGIIFGNVEFNTTTGSNITALMCSQRINQVPLKVEYRGDPGLQAIKSVQPEGQPKSVENGTSGSRTMGYALGEFMKERPSYTVSKEHFDQFFAHLLSQSKGNNLEDLAGTENVGKLIDAVKQEYNEYAMHVVSHNLRAKDRASQGSSILSAGGDEPGQPLSAFSEIRGSYSATVSHLVVDRTSKIVLQVLFAVMTTLSVIGFMLVKIRGTLPRDPCSIGSTMAFLADSQLCNKGSGVLPEGAERMSERELKDVLNGWVFSLGWWKLESSAAESIVGETDSTTSGMKVGGSVSTVKSEGKRFGIDVGKAGI
ncbi:hypothetical protein IQ07DRAFT_592503 [Pyrenochaeta sp. DS3sAY3a]|nr:hypothetical protein IQ07DRAFT_592503 [Pyrenochaeta sp. DS3sAY3a]